MSGDQRRMNPLLRPTVPLVNMQIGAADGSNFYLNQYLVPAKRRDFNLADLRPRRGFRLDDPEHGFRHEIQPAGSTITRQTLTFNIAFSGTHRRKTERALN